MHVTVFFRANEDVAPLLLLLRQGSQIPWVECEHCANIPCQAWFKQVQRVMT